MHRIAILWVGFALVTARGASAMSPTPQIIYVDQHAVGPLFDGTSWCTAHTDLQVALAQAAVGTKPIEIHVADGIYRPGDAQSSREVSFHMLNGVHLMGGYAGCGAADPDARDVATFVSTLSGDLMDDDGQGLYEDNVYHVVRAEQVGPTGMLDGFTITAGNANQVGDPHVLDEHEIGGGMSCSGGGPALIATIFRSNNADLGGALAIQECDISIRNCVFEMNTASTAGALLNYRASLLIDNCLFRNNRAGGAGQGGAIVNFYSSSSIHRTQFVNNVGQRAKDFLIDLDHGGAIYNYYSTGFIEACMFSGNRAGAYGGAIANHRRNSLVVFNSMFVMNRGYSGGAVWEHGSNNSFTFENCVFVGNLAEYQAGALLVGGHGDLIKGCTFYANSAAEGGGVLDTGVASRVTGCVFRQNSDESGISQASQILYDEFTSPDYQYNSIQGLINSLHHSGNHGEDPLFVDPLGPDGIAGTLDDDLRLSQGSPCINRGDPDVAADAPPVDIAGAPREQGCRADMGAYESPYDQALGDFDDNGVHDLADFAAFQLCYSMMHSARGWPAACTCTFDYNGDEVVNMPDLNFLVEDMGYGP